MPFYIINSGQYIMNILDVLGCFVWATDIVRYLTKYYQNCNGFVISCSMINPFKSKKK